jgi:hypothetical protein
LADASNDEDAEDIDDDILMMTKQLDLRKRALILTRANSMGLYG